MYRNRGAIAAPQTLSTALRLSREQPPPPLIPRPCATPMPQVHASKGVGKNDAFLELRSRRDALDDEIQRTEWALERGRLQQPPRAAKVRLEARRRAPLVMASRTRFA